MKFARSPLAPLIAPAQGLEYEAIVRRIAGDNHTRVLDWGCGYGQVTDLLLRAGVPTDAYEYGGPEASQVPEPLTHFSHIHVLRSRHPVDLPYPDGSFSGVLSCGVLEHVQDPDASLEEIRRVLRPDGLLYVYKLPNDRSYLEWIARRIGLDYYHGMLEHDALYSLDSARSLLEAHDFRVLDIRYANMLPLTLTSGVARRFGRATWDASKLLSAVPGLNRFATNVEVIARRDEATAARRPIPERS